MLTQVIVEEGASSTRGAFFYATFTAAPQLGYAYCGTTAFPALAPDSQACFTFSLNE